MLPAPKRILPNGHEGICHKRHHTPVLKRRLPGRCHRGLGAAQSAPLDLSEYDPDTLVKYVRSRPWLVFSRVSQVTAATTRYLTFKLQQLATINGQQAGYSTTSKEGQLICDILAGLGPTFVKLGQTLSVRPDIVGDQLSSDLAQLQDSCPPFTTTEAMRILEEELGGPPSQFFSHISATPVAAASLGQVYRCTLKSTGQEVAVKVQRPGIQESITLDIAIVRGGLGFVREVTKVNQDIRSIADELGEGLLGELDYLREADNAAAFQAAHRRLGFVAVPAAIPELTTRRLLTTGWVDGQAPAALLAAAASSGSVAERVAARRQLLLLVQQGVQCSLSQLLETGVVHADPHPGNLLLAPDGHLVYLDFGLIKRVPSQRSQAMMAALLHVAMGQWELLARDLGQLGALKPGTNMPELAADLEAEFTRLLPTTAANSLQTGAALTPGQRLVALMQTAGAGINFGQFFKVVVRLAFKYRFRLASEYLLVVR